MSKKKLQKCFHCKDRRAITGTWTTVELNKAIEKGYKVEKVYEDWHFKEKSNELFKGYFKDFIKIKLEKVLIERRCLKRILTSLSKKPIIDLELNSIKAK